MNFLKMKYKQTAHSWHCTHSITRIIWTSSSIFIRFLKCKLILIWISIVIDSKNKWKQLIWVSNQLRARSTVNKLGHVYFRQPRYRKPLNVLVGCEQREKIGAVLPLGELMII